MSTVSILNDAATQIHVQIESSAAGDISGDGVNEANHSTEIDISKCVQALSVSWSMASDNRGQSGNTRLEPIQISTLLDGSSPGLAELCGGNKPIQKVTIWFSGHDDAVGNTVILHKLTLSECRVINYSCSVDAHSSELLNHFGIAYQSMMQEHPGATTVGNFHSGRNE